MAPIGAPDWPRHPSRDERRAAGKAARRRLPLDDLADASTDGRDPVAIIAAQDAARITWLVPIRYGRMLPDPFVFYRGTAGLMAHDLASHPSSGLDAQLCGDAHLMNFGVYGSPERSMVFDLNDFDETLPGPFEWDVKRLVASMAIAARSRGFKRKEVRRIATATAWRYRDALRDFARGGSLSTWYAHMDVEALIAGMTDPALRAYSERVVSRARGKDSMQAVSRFTTVVDGRRRIVAEPPLIVPISAFTPEELGGDHPEGVIHHAFADYLRSVRDDVRVQLDRFTYVDAALKVVGVGSVGTRCVIVLLQGATDHDLLFLQVKEANASVLETQLGPSAYPHHGQRVVAGQRLMQSASDSFLGWATGYRGLHYYWRQLRDWKGSVEVERMTPEIMLMYGRLCAWTLAKAHARSGDPIAIAAYMGSSERFEQALSAYAIAYADQTERDHAALREAVAQGRVEARTDLS